MKDTIELEESVVNVTIDLPSWVWKRLNILARLQNMSGKAWIKTVVCKALKSDLKPDKVKWTDIYESFDMTDKELEKLLRQIILSRLEDVVSYPSSEEMKV